jgi:hypothetical protein
VYVWPSHFSVSCPPASAAELTGTVFRFINGRTAGDRDFMSHYERDPEKDWGDDGCIARGLSILRTWGDCEVLRKAVPAMRKKRLVHAEIATPVGLVASTPSNNCKGHCTWWRNPSPSTVLPLFSVFNGPEEAPHE